MEIVCAWYKCQKKFVPIKSHQRFHSRTCSVAHAVRLRRRRVKRRLVIQFGGACVRCGYSKSMRALNFHHRDPDSKVFGIGAHNFSWERLVTEAKKCDLLCANCHMEIEEEKDGTKVLDAGLV